MSKEELRHCPNCGSPAKVKYQDGYTWVECKRKCGCSTHRYEDIGQMRDPAAREFAIEEWNTMNVRDDD